MGAHRGNFTDLLPTPLAFVLLYAGATAGQRWWLVAVASMLPAADPGRTPAFCWWEFALWDGGAAGQHPLGLAHGPGGAWSWIGCAVRDQNLLVHNITK